MKFERQCQMATDLVDDVLRFIESHDIKEIKHIPDINEECGQQTPYDELTSMFLVTIGSYIKED